MEKLKIKDALQFLVKQGNYDLTVRQLLVLFAISEGPQTVRGLAVRFSFKKPIVTRASDKLVMQKFITRRKDPKDRRITIHNITPKGRKFASNFE